MLKAVSPDKSSDKGNGKSSVAYLVGGVVAVVFTCMAAMYKFFIVGQRRQRNQSAKVAKVSKVCNFTTFGVTELCCMQSYPLHLPAPQVYMQALQNRVVSTGALSVHWVLRPILDVFTRCVDRIAQQ